MDLYNLVFSRGKGGSDSRAAGNWYHYDWKNLGILTYDYLIDGSTITNWAAVTALPSPKPQVSHWVLIYSTSSINLTGAAKTFWNYARTQSKSTIFSKSASYFLLMQSSTQCAPLSLKSRRPLTLARWVLNITSFRLVTMAVS